MIPRAASLRGSFFASTRFPEPYPISPTATESEGLYRTWLSRQLQPLVNTPVSELTIRHLASLGLIDYDATGIAWENLGTPPVLLPTVQLYPNLVGAELPSAIMARSHGTAAPGDRALMNVRVTPAGIVTSLAALRELVSLNVNLPAFQ